MFIEKKVAIKRELLHVAAVVFGVFVACYVVIAATGIAMDKLRVQEVQFKLENACVAKFIVAGVERSEIVKRDGTCFIKHHENIR